MENPRRDEKMQEEWKRLDKWRRRDGSQARGIYSGDEAEQLVSWGKVGF